MDKLSREMKQLDIPAEAIQCSIQAGSQINPLLIDDHLGVQVTDHKPDILPSSLFDTKLPIAIEFSRCRILSFSKHLLENLGKIAHLQFSQCIFVSSFEFPPELFTLRSLGFDRESDQHGLFSQNLPRFAQLQSADCFSQHISGVDFEALAALGNLKYLRIYGSPVDKSLLQRICGINSIEHLVLEVCELKNLDKSIEKLTNLVHLDLSNNPLGSMPKELFKMEGIKQLTLSNTKLVEIPSAMGKLKNLEELYLATNKIVKIRGLKKLENLRVLDLQDNAMDKIDMKQLPTVLAILKLDNNKLKAIEFREHNNGLQEIYLEHNKLDDSSISGWEFLINIAVVNLKDNALKLVPRELITDKAIQVEI